MNRPCYSSIAAALAVALGGTALAQNQSGQGQQQRHESFQSSEQGQRAQQEMMRLDRDRDQRVTQQEAQTDPQLVAAWADIDVTRDGSIDATEYYLYAAQRRIGELESGSQSQPQARSGQPSSGSQSSSSAQSGSGQSRDSAQASGQSSNRESDAGNQRSDETVIAQAPTDQRSGQSSSTNDRGSSSDSPSFEEADRNNDGQIDRQEFQLSRL
jgi:hypothetical protein